MALLVYSVSYKKRVHVFSPHDQEHVVVWEDRRVIVTCSSARKAEIFAEMADNESTKSFKATHLGDAL